MKRLGGLSAEPRPRIEVLSVDMASLPKLSELNYSISLRWGTSVDPAAAQPLINKESRPRQRLPRAARERRMATRSALEHLRRLVLLAQHHPAVHAQPLVQNAGVYLPEVDRMLQVPVLQLGQARVLADRAGLDLAAAQEHRRRRAVVGALGAVLFGPPAELREGHHQEAVLVPAGRQVLVEGRHRVVAFALKDRVRLRLPGVG